MRYAEYRYHVQETDEEVVPTRIAINACASFPDEHPVSDANTENNSTVYFFTTH